MLSKVRCVRLVAMTRAALYIDILSRTTEMWCPIDAFSTG